MTEKADLFDSWRCQTRDELFRDHNRGLSAPHQSPARALTNKGNAVQFPEVSLLIDYQPLSVGEMYFDRGQTDQCNM